MFSKLTEIWYKGTLLYANYDFFFVPCFSKYENEWQRWRRYEKHSLTESVRDWLGRQEWKDHVWEIEETWADTSTISARR